jgi:hypothetical protein
MYYKKDLASALFNSCETASLLAFGFSNFDQSAAASLCYVRIELAHSRQHLLT